MFFSIDFRAAKNWKTDDKKQPLGVFYKKMCLKNLAKVFR